MNWMTSGRKRVKRTQKTREQRAKHFAKVAASRRVLQQQPTARRDRRISSCQSSDVVRLKSRWSVANPAVGPQLTVSSPSDESPMATRVLPTNTSTPSSQPRSGARSNDTPASLGEAAGLLDLDITPPLNAGVHSRFTYDIAVATGGDFDQTNTPAPSGPICGGARSQSRPTSLGSLTQHQQPQSDAPLTSSPLLNALFRGALPAEKRRLVFPGGHDDQEAKSCGGYEECLLGENSDLGGGVGDASAAEGHTSFSCPRNELSEDSAVGALRFFDSGVEVEADGSPFQNAPTFAQGILHHPPTSPTIQTSLRRTTDKVTSDRLPFKSLDTGGVGFPSFGGGGFGSRPPVPATSNEWKLMDVEGRPFGGGYSATTHHSLVDSQLSNQQAELDRMEVVEGSFEATPELHLSEPDDSIGNPHHVQTSYIHLGKPPATDVFPATDRAPASTLAPEACVATSIAQAWGLFDGAMNTSINQTCGVSTPPEDSPAAIDTISDNGPGETASRSMNEKSSCEQLLKAEQASHSPANSLPYAGTALPQSTLPQYPVPQTASEVDDSGDGGDSPELVMCWADKMLEGVHSDSEQEGSVLLADTDADQVTQENASGNTKGPASEKATADQVVDGAWKQSPSPQASAVSVSQTGGKEWSRTSPHHEQGSSEGEASYSYTVLASEASLSRAGNVTSTNHSGSIGSQQVHQIKGTPSTCTSDDRRNLSGERYASEDDVPTRFTTSIDACARTNDEVQEPACDYYLGKMSTPVRPNQTKQHLRSPRKAAPEVVPSRYPTTSPVAQQGSGKGTDNADINVNAQNVDAIAHLNRRVKRGSRHPSSAAPANLQGAKTSRGFVCGRLQSKGGVREMAKPRQLDEEHDHAEDQSAEVYSTIVWYRTIAACLATAIESDNRSTPQEKGNGQTGF